MLRNGKLFIESSSWSLKAVLLRNRNSFSSISVEYSEQMKETHNSMDHLLSAINYQVHKGLICENLKVVELAPGLQGWYTKYLCFLCLWDSRADDQYYVRHVWLWRHGLKPGPQNVQPHLLVKPNKILLPPLHIKLGVIKKFINTDKERIRFSFHQKCPQDKHGETQGWYIWRPSNKTQCLRKYWVKLNCPPGSSCKLPGKPQGCGIREGNWRATEEFPPT